MFLALDRKRSTTGRGTLPFNKAYHDYYRGWMMRGVQYSAVQEFQDSLTISSRCGNASNFSPAAKESGKSWHASNRPMFFVLRDRWEHDTFYYSKSSPSWVVTEYNMARGMKISCMMRTVAATKAIQSFKGWKPMESEDDPTICIEYGVEFEFKFRQNFNRRMYEKMERDFFSRLRDILHAMEADK